MNAYTNYIYTMEYYQAIKKNKLLIPATTQMNLENIMLSDRRQTQKVIYRVIPLTQNVHNRYIQKDRTEITSCWRVGREREWGADKSDLKVGRDRMVTVQHHEYTELFILFLFFILKRESMSRGERSPSRRRARHGADPMILGSRRELKPRV